MARAIDADKLKKELAPYEENDFSQQIDVILKIVDMQPTLTPPNEALTLEQLREMDGEPVWVTPLGFWALVIAKPGKRVQLISNDGETVWADKEIELVGPIYRRPAEGEA